MEVCGVSINNNKTNSLQMPSVAQDHLATLISEAVPSIKGLVGSKCLQKSWNYVDVKSRHYELRALSVSICP